MLAASRSSQTSRSLRIVRVLGAVVWGLLAFGVLLAVTVELLDIDAPDSQPLLLLMLASFFAVVIARLAAAAVGFSSRRSALVALTVGFLLWAVASAALTSGESLTDTEFPSRGETVFLLAYICMATFLLLDVRRQRGHPARVWLETAVMCGGAATLAGVVVLTPVALAYGAEGIQGFLALLYPLIDVLLATLVIGQTVMRLRDWTRPTYFLTMGFVVLAFADASLALNLHQDTYVSSRIVDVLYGLGFALVSSAACMRRPELAPVTSHNPRSWTMVSAAAVALGALALRPSGVATWYVSIPAVVTLIAVGWRLVLALRDAQGAAEALRLSRTDELTGLPNRRAVLAEIDAGLSDGRPLALMLLDVDGFKDINDSLGHAAGDAVLGAAADRMRRSIGPDLSVSRLGGDEFALVVRDEDPIALMERGQAIRTALLEPLRVEGLELAIRASVGITVRRPDDTHATDLLRRADVAMYEAKVGRSGTLLYDASRDGFSRHRLRMAEDLRRGIGEGQLEVWYQPQVDATTERVTGMEGLVRWRHPKEGLLLPLHFLPDARRSGLMLSLSVAVAGQIVADTRRWLDAGFDFRVSMNCAPPELLGGSLLPRLFEAIDAAGLPPDVLGVEVTEDSFLSDPERAREMLLEIRDHEVQVAIDDYGTGFSSLAYLRDLPIQELKMDRSFVGTIRTDARSRVIVSSTKQMAHAMGLRVVAEGVENSETAAELMAMGVDVLQGMHIAEPMRASDVSTWTRRWTEGLAAAPSARLGG